LTGFGRDRQNVSDDIGNDALGGRMKAGDFDLLLVGASIPHESVAVAGGGPCPEIDVVDGLAVRLRLGAGWRRGRLVLRVGDLNLQPRGDPGCAPAPPPPEASRFPPTITHC